MNNDIIDDENEDFNTEALDRFRDEVDDTKGAARGHIQAARRDIRICIRVAADARLNRTVPALTGRALDDHLERFIEIEGDLSRAEGELS